MLYKTMGKRIRQANRNKEKRPPMIPSNAIRRGKGCVLLTFAVLFSRPALHGRRIKNYKPIAPKPSPIDMCVECYVRGHGKGIFGNKRDAPRAKNPQNVSLRMFIRLLVALQCVR